MPERAGGLSGSALARHPGSRSADQGSSGGLLGRTVIGLWRVDQFFCRKACGAAVLVAESLPWQKTKHHGAAAHVRCCRPSFFRRRF